MQSIHTNNYILLASIFRPNPVDQLREDLVRDACKVRDSVAQPPPEVVEERMRNAMNMTRAVRQPVFNPR